MLPHITRAIKSDMRNATFSIFGPRPGRIFQLPANQPLEAAWALGKVMTLMGDALTRNYICNLVVRGAGEIIGTYDTYMTTLWVIRRFEGRWCGCCVSTYLTFSSSVF